MRYSNYPPRIRSIADAFRSVILRSLPLPLPLYTRFISSKFGLGGRGSPRSHGNCYTRALAWSRHLVFSIYGSVRKIREDPFSTNGVPIDSDDRGVRSSPGRGGSSYLNRPAGRPADDWRSISVTSPSNYRSREWDGAMRRSSLARRKSTRVLNLRSSCIHVRTCRITR